MSLSKSHTSARSEARTPRPAGDASAWQKLLTYRPASLRSARTTRLTGIRTPLELEELLLELEELLLELEELLL
jgi:hypothetical protein